MDIHAYGATVRSNATYPYRLSWSPLAWYRVPMAQIAWTELMISFGTL